MNIVKAKERGKIIYRIRDKGKPIKYLGTAERVLELVKLGEEYQKLSGTILEEDKQKS